jgi:protein polybromo-1
LCVFRDELCRGGDLLHSPALSYTLLHLAAAVEATRQQKLLQEQPEEEAETRSSEDSLRVSSNLDTKIISVQLFPGFLEIVVNKTDI